MLQLLKRQLDGIMATRLRLRAVGFGHPGKVYLKDLLEHALQGGSLGLAHLQILRLITAAAEGLGFLFST